MIITFSWRLGSDMIPGESLDFYSVGFGFHKVGTDLVVCSFSPESGHMND